MESKLIIFTGFSGAGKDTIMNSLLEKRRDITRIVTHTSRPIRPEETAGIDYHFVTTNVFLNMKRQGQLFEHKLYGEHWKGTHKDEFQKVFRGQNIVWRVDPSMAARAEEKFMEEFEQETANELLRRLIKILIKDPSIEETLQRFISREGPNANIEEFKRRLKQDEEVWEKYQHKFPHVIINHDGKQEETLQEILKILKI
jgi:guanylate kinase